MEFVCPEDNQKASKLQILCGQFIKNISEIPQVAQSVSKLIDVNIEDKHYKQYWLNTDFYRLKKENIVDDPPTKVIHYSLCSSPIVSIQVDFDYINPIDFEDICDILEDIFNDIFDYKIKFYTTAEYNVVYFYCKWTTAVSGLRSLGDLTKCSYKGITISKMTITIPIPDDKIGTVRNSQSIQRTEVTDILCSFISSEICNIYRTYSHLNVYTYYKILYYENSEIVSNNGEGQSFFRGVKDIHSSSNDYLNPQNQKISNSKNINAIQMSTAIEDSFYILKIGRTLETIIRKGGKEKKRKENLYKNSAFASILKHIFSELTESRLLLRHTQILFEYFDILNSKMEELIPHLIANTKINIIDDGISMEWNTVKLIVYLTGRIELINNYNDVLIRRFESFDEDSIDVIIYHMLTQCITIV